MWTRGQLKSKAKASLKGNYWKVILVTIIVIVLGGSSVNSGIKFEMPSLESSALFNGMVDGYQENETDIFDDDMDDFAIDENYDGEDDFITEDEFIFEEDMYPLAAIIGIVIVSVIGILLIAAVVSFVIKVFITCPIEVGTKRFYRMNLEKPAEVKEVLYAFDSNYMNIVKVLFFRELYVLGWSLLFVIPGIVKSYEYLMVPYLLAENPDLTRQEAFALSKQMMMGNKWKAFVLNLSFIGWNILSGVTLGILDIFYVKPYKALTFAALYEELSLINGRPAQAKRTMDDVYQQMYQDAQV